MTRTLVIVYASTGGHTEHVVDTLVTALDAKAKDLRIVRQRAELTKPEDLSKGDVLLFACGTWNTGNVEGQLNPHMHELLKERAVSADLKGMFCAAIALGDERYHYTAHAADHLAEFIKEHNGKLLLPPLKIINEPFGQEEKVTKWTDQLLQEMKKLPVSAAKP